MISLLLKSRIMYPKIQCVRLVVKIVVLVVVVTKPQNRVAFCPITIYDIWQVQFRQIHPDESLN